MYHQERVINGVLHFRLTPSGMWHEYSKEKITLMYLELKKENKLLKDKLETEGYFTCGICGCYSKFVLSEGVYVFKCGNPNCEKY